MYFELDTELTPKDRNLIHSSLDECASCISLIDLYISLQQSLIPLLRVDGIFITNFNEQTGETSMVVKSGAMKSLPTHRASMLNQLIANHDTLYKTPPGIVVSKSDYINLTQINNDEGLEGLSMKSNFKLIAGIFDFPSPKVGLWLYKKNCNGNVFNQREINILKYMYPFLIQTIKSLIFCEQKNTFSKIAEHFIESQIPKAVITNNSSIVMCNKKFTQQIGQLEGTKLPPPFQKQIMMLIDRQKLSQENKSLRSDNAYLRIKRRLYEINLTSITDDELSYKKTWLLKLQRISNTNLQLTRKLKDANITSRETEIIFWLKQGFSTDNISERLSVSCHTIKTHIRNIYRKLNVTSSKQLLIFLHQPNH